MQFLALMAANSQFLAVLPKQGTGLNVLYFLFILVSLVCLGGLLESRREFVIAEAARLIITSGTLFATGSWFGGLHDPRLRAAIEVFAFGSLGWVWLAARVRGRPTATFQAAA